jgi:cytochrome c556
MRALLLTLVLASAAGASEPVAAPPPSALKLTPATLELLRAEMKEVAKGMQGLSLAIASGDWATVGTVSAQIRASYLLEQKLTPAQAAELERALPARFKHLDAEFHARAERLRAAAAARDAEQAVFHHSRLLESCTSCHAEFAPQRFPGFVPAVEDHAHSH